jgi:hypothetical protein
VNLPTRALSLWAPWIWAILHCGKDIENRSLSFPKSYRGEFWLHASLWPGTRTPLNARQQHELVDEFDAVVAQSGQQRQDFPALTLGALDAMRGKIIGRVTVTGYVRRSESVWFVPGALGLAIEKPIALKHHVPAVGAQGWWNVKPDVLNDLDRAV